jgi:L-rhamnose mutarotase
VIPRDLEIALRDAGVSSWAIFRDGLDLFHVLEVADYQAMRHALRDDPANVPWQRRMSELLAAVDDLPGHDRGLKLVWELT